MLQSKAETVAIERNNGRQRHRLARFRRKSIVVSKSAEMVDLTLGLFAAYNVNKTWNPIVHLYNRTLSEDFASGGPKTEAMSAPQHRLAKTTTHHPPGTDPG